MFKYNLKISITLLTFFLSLNLQARLIEHSSIQEESKSKRETQLVKNNNSTWETYKKKALNFWGKTKSKIFKEKENKISDNKNNSESKSKSVSKSQNHDNFVLKKEDGGFNYSDNYLKKEDKIQDKYKMGQFFKIPEVINSQKMENQKQAKKLPPVLDEKGEEIIPNIPDLDTEDKEFSALQIDEGVENLKALDFKKLKSESIMPDSSLPKAKSGVPYFSLFKKKKITDKKGKVRIIKVKVDHIPKINPGQPEVLSASDFVIKDFKNIKPKYTLVKPLKGPGNLYKSDVRKWKGLKLKNVHPFKKVQRAEFGLDLLVNEERIKEALAKITPDVNDPEKPYHKFTKSHLNMLSAVILFKRGGHCHVVSGLFHDISNTKEFVEESNYYLGICSHEMGFFSESTSRLIKVVKSEDPLLTPVAIKVLIKDLPVQYELVVARALKAMKNKNLIPKEAKDGANYVLARAYSVDAQFKISKSYASKVSPTSKYYSKAQFILGVSHYALEEIPESIKIYTQLRAFMKEKGMSDDKLSSLMALNMGRIYFQHKKYKESAAEFLKVHKNSPYWIQALVEQGWSQLHSNDASGAIGNMYSLHSPYFKAVYKPESYVVRTIGYLNICQYGDAYQTLKLMEERYSPWIPKIKQFVSKKRKNTKYYDIIKTYLQGKSTQNIEGLPYQLVREIARHRDFLSLQASLNQKEDEIDQYRFINDLILKDKAKLRWRRGKSKQRLAKYKKLLKDSKVNKKLLSQQNELRAKIRNEIDFIAAIRFQLQVFEQGRQGFFRLKSKAFNRIAREKSTLKVKAGRVIKRRAKMVQAQLSQLLENNELLRYEAYAGSGQNIRYQMAKASSVKNNSQHRLPASFKPQKTLNWSVTGEYWEDEIGNYRSALKNNCPEARNKKINFKKTSGLLKDNNKGSF